MVIFVSIKNQIYLIPYSIFHTALELTKILPYISDNNQTTVLLLPNVNQSIRELQNLDLNRTIYRIAINWNVFIVGCISFIYFIVKRPSSFIFLIFLALGMASTYLGNRFTMYGGVAIGMGLGFGISIFFKDLISKTGRWLIQLGISILVLIPIIQITLHFTPSPILPKIYAKTFKELEKIAPKNARLWQWWDYGYAAQYFAKRPTFGDGGLHDGRFLYPLALVHISDSPLQASQLIKFITLNQIKEYKTSSKLYQSSPEIWKFYLPDPMNCFSEMGSEKARNFISSLKNKKIHISNIPTQYVIFSWENLKLAYWISYFGTWDITTGQAYPGRIQSVTGNISININLGKLFINNKKIELDGFIVIDKKGKTHEYSWSNGSDIFAILNQMSKEMFLMDSTIYYSNMVQMLLKPPSKISPSFKLIIDHSPWTRVYEVE